MNRLSPTYLFAILLVALLLAVSLGARGTEPLDGPDPYQQHDQAVAVHDLEVFGSRLAYDQAVADELADRTQRIKDARRQRVKATSATRDAVSSSTDRGFPCGGDLPPCWVLRRESLMAADPPRVWNGNCYMPVGSLGQCGRSTASGLWQVLRSTWKGYAGYINAADAPVAVQNDFARMLWQNGRGCSAWAAC